MLENNGKIKIDGNGKKLRGSTERIYETRSNFLTDFKRKPNWIGDIMRRNCFMNDIIQGHRLYKKKSAAGRRL